MYTVQSRDIINHEHFPTYLTPSKLGDQNSKGSCQWKLPLFSERLKAIHPAVKALGCFLLAGRRKFTNFDFLKI